MALINVKLRIVGLYFNETVEIDDTEDFTVRDVLDKYIAKHPNISVVGGLEYIRFPFPGNNSDFVKTFTYHYGGIYNFDANNKLEVAPPPSIPTPAAPDGLTLGKQNRLPGIYTLSEDFEDELVSGATKPVGLVWQYYVTDSIGVSKSKTPVDRGFQAFGEDATYILQNDDIITWRLVAICRKPNYNQ
jgi:hypothetical protein